MLAQLRLDVFGILRYMIGGIEGTRIFVSTIFGCNDITALIPAAYSEERNCFRCKTFEVHSERTLYIKSEGRHTLKGEVEKIYLVCYPIWEKKETPCNNRVGVHKALNYQTGSF